MHLSYTFRAILIQTVARKMSSSQGQSDPEKFTVALVTASNLCDPDTPFRTPRRALQATQ
jgi:hypothetical protein